MSLTGKFTFRRTMTGKIVLQVEEEKAGWLARRGAALRRRWRDATLMDMAQPEMRALIDLRFKPRFLPQNHYAAPGAAPAVQGADEAAVPAGGYEVFPAHDALRKTAH